MHVQGTTSAMHPPLATGSTPWRAALTQVLCLLHACPLLQPVLTRHLLCHQPLTPGQTQGTDERRLMTESQGNMHPGGEAGYPYELRLKMPTPTQRSEW